MPVSTLLLLSNQFIFMVGFYMVVPFLAAFMRDDLRLESAVIGLVLGLRTFSQQGLFIVGGAFADRLGARRLILLGCMLRIVGFVVLGLSDSFLTVLLGACLTGLAGSLFSPAISSLAAEAGEAAAREGKGTRLQFFARLAVWGELGAVVGPLLGALLLGVGFKAMAFAGAGVFLLAYIVLHIYLPRSGSPVLQRQDGAWWHVFTDKLFVAFTLAHAGFLFSYNQLYFALPVEVKRAGGSDMDLAPLFMIASVMIVVLQLPAARLAQKLSWAASLAAGFLLMALAFALTAYCATFPAPSGPWRLAPAIAMVALLILGQMIVKPVAMDIVPRFAKGRPTGIYYGALASVGGLAVLVGNILLGPILDLALVPSVAAAIPWLALAAVPALGGLAMIPIMRRLLQRQGA
ncbi:MFS transporter [Devosia yakushimensis]|uniref:MFS transporter n=1 Tax=Devosia yakushimensis TaxID=470028 RepID=A0ABQ5UIA9_9HYPH|nr:MFS transporter [Devosia yakushimensis]GLQ11353.1 MFS transporter [Devosia yakushimensis]